MRLKELTVLDIDRAAMLQERLHQPGTRLGLITSIDGAQLITLILHTVSGEAELWHTPLQSNRYQSLTPHIAQAHWQERSVWDMFGLFPVGHPRLKHNLLHQAFRESFFPLVPGALEDSAFPHRSHTPMKVSGSGIYEVPVGPIHAGIIEPGHFRFSCLGEVVYNLEIRLGYLHRGVEKRIVETPLSKQRFIAEAVASDSAVAYALAHATAIEDLCDIEVPDRALYLRSLALEVERVAMHISDLGGLAGDIGYLGVAATLSRLRGVALQMGELICGSRLMRGFVCPGGVLLDPDNHLLQLQTLTAQLQNKILSPLNALLSNQVAIDRLDKIGRVSRRLAADFGLTGPTARASDLVYDVRQHFPHGIYPQVSLAVNSESGGDVLSRTKVRIAEVKSSLNIIQSFIDSMPAGSVFRNLPRDLPANSFGIGVVESHRGELIHMACTDEFGKLKRYAIKDASVNNWTALAIAVRSNLLADFPLCNKSFALSYGGHDL
ncbi:MAG: NADH-quinone oxidoreductase subunit C [Cyanobacteria bacterium SZAS-4]|nr:NADH-quinone oxidoreductase subunit C [Cyanobacteria bacterium SZAS-4]